MTGLARNHQGEARFGGMIAREILEKAGVSTPAYVYDLGAIEHQTQRLVDTLGSRGVVAFALKANSAGSVARTIFGCGAGADVVSGGELMLALATGAAPDRVVMSGVGKQAHEIDLCLQRGILALQCESVEEVVRVAERARTTGSAARVSLRLNPGVEIDSHAHIATGHDEAKFGVALSDLPHALRLIDEAQAVVKLVGLSVHIGSMLTERSSYLDAARTVCQAARARREQGRPLELVDFGGGFAIDYGAAQVETPESWAAAARELADREGLADLKLVIEPGRSLVGPFGVLLAGVIQRKVSSSAEKVRRWIIIDAGMNDLLRPALYQAHHRVEGVDRAPQEPTWRVVGPVCESSDDFGLHPLGDGLHELVVIRDAGAYGYTMASEYNGRALPAEIFVRHGEIVSVSKSPGVERWVQSRLDA